MIIWRDKREYGSPVASLISINRDLNYGILLKIFNVQSAMQLNIIHGIALILFYIELFFIYSMLFYIKSKGNFHISWNDFIFVGGFEAIYLLFRFNTLPYWVDDDKVEKTTTIVFSEQSSDDLIKDIIDKDIQNIHQDQIATEIAQKATKKVSKSNTITIKMQKGLDLKNNTIILTSKSQKHKIDDE